uniref:Transmembrane protein n=1 Tax=Knipowitschia caucasica TaxID=637954 RepID=A0AAV2JN95_KNICA
MPRATARQAQAPGPRQDCVGCWVGVWCCVWVVILGKGFMMGVGVFIVGGGIVMGVEVGGGLGGVNVWGVGGVLGLG